MIYATVTGNEVVAINSVTLPGIVGEMVFDDASGGPSKLSAEPRPNHSLRLARAEQAPHE
jgi:hypothetical protein